MGWYPDATRDELPGTGGGHAPGYARKIVLHTTQGSSYAGARAAYLANRSAPNFTVGQTSAKDLKFKVRQHMDAAAPARALRNASGGVETNRGGACQIEIVGMAGALPDDDDWWDEFREFARWLERDLDVPSVCTVQFRGVDDAYGLRSSTRLSARAWTTYSGWLGHQHVPENTHWDPGTFDIGRLLDHPRRGQAASTTASAPTRPRSWLDMVNKEELEAVVRDVVRKELAGRKPVLPAFLFGKDDTQWVPWGGELVRLEDLPERAQVERAYHLPVTRLDGPSPVQRTPRRRDPAVPRLVQQPGAPEVYLIEAEAGRPVRRHITSHPVLLREQARTGLRVQAPHSGDLDLPAGTPVS